MSRFCVLLILSESYGYCRLSCFYFLLLCALRPLVVLGWIINLAFIVVGSLSYEEQWRSVILITNHERDNDLEIIDTGECTANNNLFHGVSENDSSIMIGSACQRVHLHFVHADNNLLIVKEHDFFFTGCTRIREANLDSLSTEECDWTRNLSQRRESLESAVLRFTLIRIGCSYTFA